MTAQSLTLSAWAARRLPDENVFDRTLRGDPVAFSEVYRRYQKRIHGYCLARSLDPDMAADATQEVFMKLLRAEPGSIDSPQAWLFTVARNVVIDAVRKRARTPEDSGIDEESQAWDRLKSADTADEVMARSDARNVFLALRTVRPRYRTALVMRDIHGQTAKDMAEALETTPGAVDTLVSRARDAFGVAYAAVSDLPSTCRANVELIYRNLGTGITDVEKAALQGHLSECPRCRAESKRANNPHHLPALLPFLVPARRFAHGVLDQAALSTRVFPEAFIQQTGMVLSQPHTWNLATKIAAGLAAVAIVTAPVAATTLRTTRVAPAIAAAVQTAAPHAGSATWTPSGTMTGNGASSYGSGSGATMAGSGTGGTASGSRSPAMATPKTSTPKHRSSGSSGGTTAGSGSTGGSMGSGSSGSGTWSGGSSGSSGRSTGSGSSMGGPGGS